MEVYKTKHCTLYLGNCLDIMPTLADCNIDAVVTDPPYGVDGGVGRQTIRGKARYSGAFRDDEANIRSVCVPIIEYLLQLGIPMAVTTGNKWLHLYPPARDIGCFWTPAAIGCGPWGFTTFHPILYYGKDWRGGRWPSGKQVTERAKANGHPCPKPLGAWRWLVEKVSQPKQTVFDPFMGSGTTGVACVETGRNFIGVEINPTYFEIAKKRIDKAEYEASQPQQISLHVDSDDDVAQQVSVFD
jgi:DNA modification methylase